VRLENAALRMDFLPQWGAKVHALTHKRTGAPLLLENPIHMPMNNAVRKPFASGECS
jgi:galactose mutarotase-like enzyme